MRSTEDILPLVVSITLTVGCSCYVEVICVLNINYLVIYT